MSGRSGTCAKRQSQAFRAKVAFVARKGRETVIELAARYEVRLAQIQAWYKALAVAEDAPGQERRRTAYPIAP